MQFVNEHETLLEMARVGYFDNLEIIIWTDDGGNIPHFHIRDRNTHGKDFDCCVRIDKPEYFIHNNHNDKLNSKQIKNLIKFLTADSTFGSIKLKNWDKILMYWNDNNSNILLEPDSPMPDYSLLNN